MANEHRRSKIVSIGNWMWTLLLASIPVVNIIFFIVTACSAPRGSKRSWAIANLIWFVICAALIACIILFFGNNLVSGVTYLIATPVADLSVLNFFKALFLLNP